jgi:hypothetical protein
MDSFSVSSGRSPLLCATPLLMLSTAISAATSPARCPPMPSAITANRAGVRLRVSSWKAETA